MASRKPCEACRLKDETIAALKMALAAFQNAGPGAPAGPTVMEQLADEARGDSEDYAERARKFAEIGSRFRGAYAHVHQRDPYADCKVIRETT